MLCSTGSSRAALRCEVVAFRPLAVPGGNYHGTYVAWNMRIKSWNDAASVGLSRATGALLCIQARSRTPTTASHTLHRVGRTLSARCPCCSLPSDLPASVHFSCLNHSGAGLEFTTIRDFPLENTANDNGSNGISTKSASTLSGKSTICSP